jgi:hypothetical protein
MKTRESAEGQNLPGPRSLLYRSIALLVANLALAILPGRTAFMPSDLAIGLGVVFGLLCAGYHMHAIRLARQRLEDLNGRERESMQRQLGKPLLILALVHVAVGTASFAKGMARLYTTALGHSDEVTYVVFDVVWKERRLHCYKYTFKEMSLLQNYFGAPCLDLEYAPGTRFHYRGESSPLGFKHDDPVIESEQLPSLHERHR